jgi:opacity protein-like surface antigen
MSTRFLTGVAAAVLCSFAAQAQQVANPTSATYPTPDGPLTVHSGQPGPRQYAPPPPFAQLARGKGYITSADAEGYDLLANDFIHADGNRDGRISQAEYERWVRER